MSIIERQVTPLAPGQEVEHGPDEAPSRWPVVVRSVGPLGGVYYEAASNITQYMRIISVSDFFTWVSMPDVFLTNRNIKTNTEDKQS